MSSSDDDLRQRFRTVSASQVGDAMNRLNVMDQGVVPLGDFEQLVGRAFTVQTAAGDNKMIHEAIAEIVPGDVLVVDAQSDTTRALVGELLAERYQKIGCAGFVIDGAVRDAKEIASLRFPVYARGITPAGPYRHGPGRLSRAVSVGGVVVSPGDWIIGDRDGIAVVPSDEAEEIVGKSEAKREHEHQQQLDIRAGRVV